MKYQWISVIPLLSLWVLSAQAQVSIQPNVNSVHARDLDRAHHLPHNPPPADSNLVRKRAEYGQGFRYGRSVSSGLGDITIWNPAPANGYGGRPQTGRNAGFGSRVMLMPPIGVPQ